MPIQLLWQPNATPPVRDLVDLGLQIGGDDTSLSSTAATPGRVRLIEVRDTGRTAGTAEGTADPERLIATFHGSFHFDPAARRADRITFEIFVGSSTVQPHDQTVQGFDPECVFGVDALVLTFVNRQFVIFFPFHVDSRSEGGFLEIQAVAEVVTANGGTVVRELGRSMVLNLGIRRTHAVDTTSNLPSGAALAYTGGLIGNIILFHEDYLLPGGVRNAAQSTPQTIVLDAARIPVPARATGGSVTFAPYVANSMNVILMIDLLDDVSPPDSFLTRSITGVTNAAPVRTDTIARFRRIIQARLGAVLPNAGFAGAHVFWQDEAGAAALVTAFTGAFRRRRGNWDLNNSAAPLVTSFWNFFIASGAGLSTAGEGEQIDSANTQVTIGARQVFLNNTLPIGGGTKRLTQPMRIATGVFQDLLMVRSGLPRTYPTLQDYNDAVDRVAGKMSVLIAHEIGHSLGLMHHCKVENGANYSESNGSPVLSTMSAGVESGGFGIGMVFSAQAKVIWAAVFGVTPTFPDTFLQNKVWTLAQVFTMDWSTRMTNFIRGHGEGSIARPLLGVLPGTVPPFAVAPPGAQRGTFR
jgi:Metallo-peptidase family M12B Reprolysin-like